MTRSSSRTTCSCSTPAFDQSSPCGAGQVDAAGAPAEDVLREDVLAEVYGDEHVRARHAFGRTFVWSEL